MGTENTKMLLKKLFAKPPPMFGGKWKDCKAVLDTLNTKQFIVYPLISFPIAALVNANQDAIPSILMERLDGCKADEYRTRALESDVLRVKFRQDLLPIMKNEISFINVQFGDKYKTALTDAELAYDPEALSPPEPDYDPQYAPDFWTAEDALL